MSRQYLEKIAKLNILQRAALLGERDVGPTAGRLAAGGLFGALASPFMPKGTRLSHALHSVGGNILGDAVIGGFPGRFAGSFMGGRHALQRAAAQQRAKANRRLMGAGAVAGAGGLAAALAASKKKDR